MDSVLPSEHICSMDNCHLAMCSGEKKNLIYLVNYVLVQQLVEEIYHNLYVHFGAQNSIHRICINFFFCLDVSHLVFTNVRKPIFHL